MPASDPPNPASQPQSSNHRVTETEAGALALSVYTKAGGDQAFKFIGTEKFHGKAGELRFVKDDGDTFVYGDVNGNGKADFAIALDRLLTLTKSDFIL